MVRPRTINDKGTLDEYRRPKLAYDQVRLLVLSPFACTARKEPLSRERCMQLSLEPSVKKIQTG